MEITIIVKCIQQLNNCLLLTIKSRNDWND